MPKNDFPQRCPIIRTCEYVTFHGRRDFAHVVKVTWIERGTLSGIVFDICTCHSNGRNFLNWIQREVIEEKEEVIPLQGIYLNKTIFQKDTCTPMFIEALNTIAKTWKQPKYPSTEEWIKKMWYTYTTEYCSAIKKKWNNAIWCNMDGPRDYHTEWSQTEKDKYHMKSPTHGI